MSNARNTGLEAATGEIVAYTDDDARPDPHWLTYLAASFLARPRRRRRPEHRAPGDGPIADCVANAPGGPVHVLLSDKVAEHIPGCNMAFRHGMPPGDRGGSIRGSAPPATTSTSAGGCRSGAGPSGSARRRWSGTTAATRSGPTGSSSWATARPRRCWRRKWPEKYNAAGHVAWAGRLYGKGLLRELAWRRRRVYHGVWGSAPFQSVYGPAPSGLFSMAAMPEWYLVIFGLGGALRRRASLGAATPRPALVRARSLTLAGAGRSQCCSCPLQGARAGFHEPFSPSPPEVAQPYGVPSSAPATSTPVESHALRSCPLAAWPVGSRIAVVADYCCLERALARPRAVAHPYRSDALRTPRCRQPRR